jgi:hypothetical protein
MKVVVDLTLADGIDERIDSIDICDALLDFLCGAGEIDFPDELIQSVDGVEWMRQP